MAAHRVMARWDRFCNDPQFHHLISGSSDEHEVAIGRARAVRGSSSTNDHHGSNSYQNRRGRPNNNNKRKASGGGQFFCKIHKKNNTHNDAECFAQGGARPNQRTQSEPGK